MRYTAAGVVSHCTAESFSRYFFCRNGFDNSRARDEHLAGVLYHVDKVRDSRAVYSTASAGPHDNGNLRDNAGSSRVAEEDTAVTGQSIYSFLNARTTGIVNTDTGSTHLHGQIHDLPNLMCMLFTQRTAFNGKILCVSINQTAINRTITGHDTFAGQVFLFLTEVGAAMFHKHIQFNESTFIEQFGDTFTGCLFAFRMLFFNAGLAAALHDMFFFGMH